MTQLLHIDKQGIQRQYLLTTENYGTSDEAWMCMPNFKEGIDKGINCKSLLELSHAICGILYSIDLPGDQNTLFDSLDKDALSEIESVIEKYWERRKWQYLGSDAILFHYFHSNTYNLPSDYAEIANWHYNKRTGIASLEDEEGGNFLLRLSEEDWNSAVQFEDISDYLDIDDTERWGYFYSEAEETEMKQNLIAIIQDVNNVIKKWDSSQLIILNGC